jgi:hypothetical protein
MRLVVADTGPPNYLVLVGASEVLPTLFDKILVPEVVWAEPRHRRAPEPVSAWAARLPCASGFRARHGRPGAAGARRR